MLLILQAREINYIPYVHELSCAAYCNPIGAWKFLNGDKPDVHDSPDPLSLPGCVGGAEYETRANKLALTSVRYAQRVDRLHM